MLPRKAKWLLVLLLPVCSACTTLDVTTEHDPSADFSRYKTFSLADPADIGETRSADEVVQKNRIEPAISRELITKGLRQIGTDQQPDLAVYYWVNVTETQKKAWQRGYGWGATHGGAVPTYSYREGTLVLDLVEPTKKELVWRATIMAPLRETRTENLDLAIKAVAQAFGNYPPGKHQP